MTFRNLHIAGAYYNEHGNLTVYNMRFGAWARRNKHRGNTMTIKCIECINNDKKNL